jgi:hypothetical protein
MSEKNTIDPSNSSTGFLRTFVAGLVVGGVGVLLLFIGVLAWFGLDLAGPGYAGWCFFFGLLLTSGGVNGCLVALSARGPLPTSAAASTKEKASDSWSPGRIFVAGVIGVASGVILTVIGCSGGWMMGFGTQPSYSPVCFALGLPAFGIGVLACLVAFGRFLHRD